MKKERYKILHFFQLLWYDKIYMDTKIYNIDNQKPDKNIIEEAASIIREGGLVAFPT